MYKIIEEGEVIKDNQTMQQIIDFANVVFAYDFQPDIDGIEEIKTISEAIEALKGSQIIVKPIEP